MIQTFQCPVCGTLNAFGEPACTRCGQAFIYNCPVCGFRINNQYTNCPSCNTVFNWCRPVIQEPEETVKSIEQPVRGESRVEVRQLGSGAERAGRRASGGGGLAARPLFWVALVVVCVILIAVILVVDHVINA